MNGDNSIEVNWKIFRKDPQVGKLLCRLYGAEEQYLGHVTYPPMKTTTVSSITKRSNWTFSFRNPAGKKVKKGNISVPKVGSTRKNPNGLTTRVLQGTIDAIPRRKTMESCTKTIRDLKTYAKAYRPPNHKVLTNEEEKDRLSKVLENYNQRGGSLSSREGKNEDSTHICTSSKFNESSHLCLTEGPSKSIMANQIYHEIKERCHFQLEMEGLDHNYSSAATIQSDIMNRINELMKYDKDLAFKLINSMQ
jgi:hypothetical protein